MSYHVQLYIINSFQWREPNTWLILSEERRRQILDKYFQNNGEKKNTRWILSKWGEEKYLVLPGSPCSLPVELVLASSSMGLQSPCIIIQVAGHHHHHHHSIGIYWHHHHNHPFLSPTSIYKGNSHHINLYKACWWTTRGHYQHQNHQNWLQLLLSYPSQDGTGSVQTQVWLTTISRSKHSISPSTIGD